MSDPIPHFSPSALQRTEESAEFLVCLDYCDGAEEAEVKRVIGGYGAVRRSLVALLGVVAEGCSVMMLLVTGVEYIPWSGAKVASETNGIEEIILASLAIAFINEIDEARTPSPPPPFPRVALRRLAL